MYHKYQQLTTVMRSDWFFSEEITVIYLKHASYGLIWFKTLKLNIYWNYLVNTKEEKYFSSKFTL